MRGLGCLPPSLGARFQPAQLADNLAAGHLLVGRVTLLVAASQSCGAPAPRHPSDEAIAAGERYNSGETGEKVEIPV
jgi:hypothetical protein